MELGRLLVQPVPWLPAISDCSHQPLYREGGRGEGGRERERGRKGGREGGREGRKGMNRAVSNV